MKHKIKDNIKKLMVPKYKDGAERNVNYMKASLRNTNKLWKILLRKEIRKYFNK